MPPVGTKSNYRKFRRRRRRTGFLLLLSLVIVVFGTLIFTRVNPPNLQPGASRNVEKDIVHRVGSPVVSDAPEAVSEQKENQAALLASKEAGKSASEKQQVAKEASEKQASQQAQKQHSPQKPAIPTPPTNDLWMSIPALGLYDNYVTNTSDFSAMDYGAIKLPETGFPWQPNANTYIAAHRLGWPGTASYHQFYNLPLLAIGDVIYLGDVNGTTYTYEVTGFKEVTPDQTWITAPQAGRDMVSLQTCIENYGDYWTMGPNWYVRYVVQADRVSVDPGA